jgi:hypothetical protein
MMRFLVIREVIQVLCGEGADGAGVGLFGIMTHSVLIQGIFRGKRPSTYITFNCSDK